MIRKKVRALAVLGLCAAALAATIAAAGRDGLAASPAVVTASPKAARARTGSLVRIRVAIRGAADVGSVPFTLLYDPAVLEFLPAASREGPFLRRDGASTTFLAVAGTTPSMGPGVVVGLSRMSPRRGARGGGTLCELVFRARAPGVSALSFVRAHVLDPKAAALPASFRGTTVSVRAAR